jgi:hypothetical protein
MAPRIFKWVLISILLSAQLSVSAQFADDFTDGDFTNNPTWTGVTSHFQINATNQLWLNAPPVTATSHLVTPSNAIGNAQFDFNVKMDFDPSGSNYCKVYLTSTDSNLSGALDGYFVRIGGASGTIDDVSLFYQNGITDTKIINGTNGTVAVSPDLKIRVTRDMAGNWELLTDTNLNGTYISEGTAFHNQTITSSYFGVFCIYTSSRSNKFFFDNFVVTGGLVVDIDPPVLDSASANSLTQVAVYFNEKINVATGQNAANYSLDNGVGSPNSANIDAVDSTLVHLSFSTGIPNNTNYILTVTNVEDLAGNAIASSTAPFLTAFAVPFNYGDVVINEIYPDPTPSNGLPEEEYIELVNTTSSTINLNNWTYTDGSTTVTLSAYDLAVGNHLILCHEDDTSLFLTYGNVLGLPSWPTLNNSGDNLGLRDGLNSLIDSVDYTSSWYQDAAKAAGGWSLERINPNALCSDANNWKASTNGIGGSPGLQNSIFNNQPDNTLPQVQSFEVVGLNTIQLVFSKSIKASSIQTTDFDIDNGLSVVSFTAVNFSTINIVVNPNMTDSEIYTLDISKIEDCLGNEMNDTSLTIAIGREANQFDIVFTEILASPNPANVSLPEAEFVEIYNASSDPISLNGMAFSDRSTSVTLPNGVLFPGEYAILVEDVVAANFERFGKVIALSSWPSLNNSGDLITLTATSGIIDMVLYSDTWYNDDVKKSEGWSLELVNPEILCLGATNWTASKANEHATPGQENSVYDNSYSVDFNLNSASVINLTSIELIFSKQIDISNAISSNFLVDNGVVSSVTVNPEELNKVIINLSAPLIQEVLYEITVINMVDCSGNALLDSIIVVSLPNQQDLLINEVLFNPNTGGSDFIELYNTTTNSIDLKGWSLLYFNNAGDSAYKTISLESYVVKPGQFVVLTEDSNNILFEYPNSAEGIFLKMDLPTYSNAEGEVTVLNQMGLLNDQFIYSETMHFELITDFKGVTLERVNYQLGVNTKNNWHSAASTSGFATPGFENSQYLNGSEPDDKVVVAPKTFSPNNDGYKDVTAIRYDFDIDGLVATVTIHNENGQLIKTLINNQSIDATGELNWDGTNENEQILPTGMYIVMFRVFDINNNQNVYKNVIVLAMP